MRAGKAELVEKGAGRESKASTELPVQSNSWPEIDDEPVGNADSLVMVMFPAITWQAFSELAKKLELTTAETINEALRLLQEKTEDKDGA